MNTKIRDSLALTTAPNQTISDPASSEAVSDLLDAKIIIGGTALAETAFTKTLLEVSGFSHIQTWWGEDS